MLTGYLSALNSVDIIIIILSIILAVIGYSWGFIKQVLVVTSWVGATFIAFLGLRFLRPFINLNTNYLLNDSIVLIILFLCSMLFFTIIKKRVNNMVRNSVFNKLDYIIGALLFSSTCGALIITTSLSVFAMVWSKDSLRNSELIRGSKLLIYVESFAKGAFSFIPKNLLNNSITEQLSHEVKAYYNQVMLKLVKLPRDDINLQNSKRSEHSDEQSRGRDELPDIWQAS